MVKTAVIIVGLLLTGAFLNSKHSPTNAVCDRIVDRTVQFFQQTSSTAKGLATDVQTEVTKKN